MSLSSPSEGRLEGTLGVRHVSAGGQNTELLNDFLLLFSGPATPGLATWGPSGSQGLGGKVSIIRKGRTGTRSDRTSGRGGILSCLRGYQHSVTAHRVLSV